MRNRGRKSKGNVRESTYESFNYQLSSDLLICNLYWTGNFHVIYKCSWVDMSLVIRVMDGYIKKLYYKQA